jgi:hypothetical protein
LSTSEVDSFCNLETDACSRKFKLAYAALVAATAERPAVRQGRALTAERHLLRAIQQS